MSAAPALSALQQWLGTALTAAQAPARSESAQRLLPGARLDAAACLAIYRRSYILRLRRCLAEQFPATRQALGAALFDDFADSYLADCPSDSYTLYELGRRYPAWLEDNRPDRDAPAGEHEDWIDFLVDLARYERELFRLFDAPGHEGQPWPQAEADDAALVLQPCLSLACYRYPVAAYYHAVRQHGSADFPPAQASWLVLLRRDYQTTTYPVSALHYRFLQQLQAGAAVPQALQDIAAWTGRDIDAVRQSWCSEVREAWLAAGFFIRREDAGGAAA